MRKLEIAPKLLTEGAQLLRQEGPAQGEGKRYLLRAAKEGAGICTPWLMDGKERYFTLMLKAQETHSVALNLLLYGKESGDQPVMTVRFGILPQVETMVYFDMEWLDGHVLFPESIPGELKIVCHGSRISRNEITRAELKTLPAFHDLSIWMSELAMCDELSEEFRLPEGKLVDALGQNKTKEWPGKTRNLDDLKEILQEQMKTEPKDGYPFGDWSSYGGWKEKKLGEGTGFFTKYKENGRWWLADPDGYAFFSAGPDCVGLSAGARVDGVEKWLDWLPDQEDPAYAAMFAPPRKREGERRRNPVMFSFLQANLYRALGEDWYEKWKGMIVGQLKQYGMNTLGNWSDERLFGVTDIPYVTSLSDFPDTEKKIFRDFPDVLSPEYAQNAEKCAQALEKRREDPWMIGYFLRNEPSWAFVDNLVLADEVLRNPEKTVCRQELISFLKERYGSIEKLNEEWGTGLDGFECFDEPQEKVSAWSQAACLDMKEFSRRLLRAYVEIPSRACRRVDPNHMILGMRWAWISDPDLVSGWENFDVFSINCYAQDPTSNIENIVKLGVDLPVMIGEFHFGALDAGPSATGLEGVRTQKDRGIAYRYYCERVAAHPNGVGCHYFQCYDQFVLGRFDGENYNIGLFDVCSRPYPEMMEQVRACGQGLYPVAAGEREPAEEKAQEIPMIAY